MAPHPRHPTRPDFISPQTPSLLSPGRAPGHSQGVPRADKQPPTAGRAVQVCLLAAPYVLVLCLQTPGSGSGWALFLLSSSCRLVAASQQACAAAGRRELLLTHPPDSISTGMLAHAPACTGKHGHAHTSSHACANLQHIGPPCCAPAVCRGMLGDTWLPRVGAAVCAAHYVEHQLREPQGVLLLVELQDGAAAAAAACCCS